MKKGGGGGEKREREGLRERHRNDCELHLQRQILDHDCKPK